jgi:hypothetical protein
VPVTVNARLSAAAEVDKCELDVEPGEDYIFELQARELGTSKLTGLITVYDEKGNRLASGGDGPLPVDVAAVQASSRTLGDPYLQFTVPEGIRKLTVTVEDLARRGGTHYAYRFSVTRGNRDFRAMITTPYVNIPAGGSAIVNFAIERRGYTGPLRIEAVNLPKGIEVAGGNIPQEIADPSNRSNARRGFLSLTAPVSSSFSEGELSFRVTGTDEDGKAIVREAAGIAYTIGVAGATAQGVVDRQRPLTGANLGYRLPAMLASAPPATLELKLESTAKKEAGFEFRYRWQWHIRNTMQKAPETVSVDLPNFIDLRVIEMAVDKTNPTSGTFLVTSTKNTLPAEYNIGINGRLMADGQQQEIYSPLQSLTVPIHDSEEKTANASNTARP